MSTAFEKIWDLARQCPPGRVVTYGELARLAGNPRWSRVAGYAMHGCPDDVPWHRVVDRQGRLCPGAEERQRALLEEEGVGFTDPSHVDMDRFSWLGR